MGKRTSPPEAPYALFVAIGAFVVVGAVAFLFLWSSKQIQPQHMPIVVPTVVVDPDSGTDTDAVERLDSDANAFNVNDLDSEIGVIDQDK